jgi:5,6,7,8-tetrahydromethanopterin hydro-lyase
VTATFGIRIGEAFAGDGAEAAHVNIVIGHRSELGATFALALASPSTGHTPFVTVLKPGVPVKPLTLFVNKATIAGDEHGNLTWGAAQAGVAVGMIDAVAGNTSLAELADDLVAIAAVWVNPQARNEAAVFANNVASTRDAVAAAVSGGSRATDILAERDSCHNPFFDARPLLAGQPGAGNAG